MNNKYIEKYELLGYSREQAKDIISNFDKACEYIDAFIELGCPIPIIEITKAVGVPQKLLGLEFTEKKTDLQKIKDLLDEIGVEYTVCIHVNGIKELGVHSEYLYRNKLTNKVHNAVNIVFDADNKFMYFEGMSWK